MTRHTTTRLTNRTAPALVAALTCMCLPFWSLAMQADDDHEGHDHGDSGSVMMNQPAAPATDMTLDRALSASNGSLAVKVIQGTEYGDDVGFSHIQLHLFHRGQVLKTIEADVDEHGVVVLEDLPVAMDVQPVVTVHYDDVQYQGMGPMLTPANPTGTMEVTVYDTTGEEPEWHIAMRHVMMQPGPNDGKLWVNETVVVSNPENMTWLGTRMDSNDEKKAAARFNIPKGASNVELVRGFHGWCCTKLADEGELQVQMPLMPGNNEYTFHYSIPIVNSNAALSLAAPVRTANMMAMVPDDGSTLDTESLEFATTQSMGSSNVRIYQGTNLAASTPINFVINGIPSMTATAMPGMGGGGMSAPGQQAGSGTLNWAKTIALGGIGALFIIGIMVIVFRSSGGEAELAGAGSSTTSSSADSGTESSIT